MRVVKLMAAAVLAFGAASSPVSTGPAVARARIAASCGIDCYINSSGHCVHRPVQAATAPSGATANCRDGTFSFSEHRRGTCSYHGGVARWL